MSGEQRPAPRLTWADAAYERRYTEIADRLVHLDSYDAPALVVDLWEDPEHPRQVQVVVSVRRGVSAATAAPFIPEWAALARETEPAADPRARLMEALLQGHLRAQERLTGETGLSRRP
jgi:hypothetical protein